MNTPENSNTASPSEHAGDGVDWEGRYRAGDTPWEKGAPHPALVDWLRRNPLTGRVLVPGCGAGHDVREIARNPDCEPVGIDLAPSAIRRAEDGPRAGRESYVLGDFLAGSARGLGEFDAIFEHTCYCAIPPSRRHDYAREAAAALRPGGLLIGVFFTDPGNPDPDSPPFRCPAPEVIGMFSADFELLESREGIPTHPGREGREVWMVFRKR